MFGMDVEKVEETVWILGKGGNPHGFIIISG